MPTILNKNGFRFFFYVNDHYPMHIHVEKDDKTAKFKNIRKLVEENIELFKNKWKEFYDNN